MTRLKSFQTARLAVHAVFALAILLYVGVSVVHGVVKMRAAAAMADAANKFLASLTPGQKAVANFRFDDERRTDWHFIPRERKGVELKDLNPQQRKLAMALVQTIGSAGSRKVQTLMELEDILRDMEGANIPAMQAPDGSLYKLGRGSDLYNITVYGRPAKNPWGWSVEGHHVSVNITIIDGEIVSTPLFLGAAPAEVRAGSRKGLRPLAVEEDKARELLRSLDTEQRTAAMVSNVTHGDIVTYNNRKADPLHPPRTGVWAMGLAAAKMTPAQKAILKQFIDEYLARMPEEAAAERARRLYASDFDKVFFAWTGSAAPGERNYYRIQGSTFLIEFDNSQTPSAPIPEPANHIHSVWRDFRGDFGADLLREHYAASPHAEPLIRDVASVR